ncbi:aryl-alcohol dehydrogenase-like predicted oxidoreductase [Sulfitobacter undariae]|uniref:Aryl-alcohol dehydrogenase-like predicted oxidoreductase n=1 Tax=Sulfitobacter undariae TaxID=1563671 RepID=A0A7W6H338_9RHOB|nr:aldo/keto reductase [Sulfitobacter undariae]MBB3995479.1 aryl-alcohol dehydrogenase-like predicted oxidoreductase [Sulfitobacter undariae]
MKNSLTSLDGTPASRLAFGTMQFGGRADATASRAMFEAALDAGITHFDTAHVYTDGASEELLGALAKPHRDRLIIATKAAYTGGATPENIRNSAETSRKRMKIDVIDALYLHRFDPDTDMHDSFEALADLKTKGIIRHVGISNFAAWQAVKAAQIAAKFDLEIALIQPMYSLVKRQAEVEILPMAQDMGMLCAPYSPLGGGLLTGKYASGGTGRLSEDARYAARYRFDHMHSAAEGLSTIAARESVASATLAVAWAAAHPTAPTPIISARSAEQLAPSLAALDYTMHSDLYTELAALVPAPPPATDRAEEQ